MDREVMHERDRLMPRCGVDLQRLLVLAGDEIRASGTGRIPEERDGRGPGTALQGWHAGHRTSLAGVALLRGSFELRRRGRCRYLRPGGCHRLHSSPGLAPGRGVGPAGLVVGCFLAPAGREGWPAWVSRAVEGDRSGCSGVPSILRGVSGWRTHGRGALARIDEAEGRLAFVARLGGARDLSRIESGTGLTPAFRQEPRMWGGDRHDVPSRSLPRLGDEPGCSAPPALEPTP